MHHRAILSLAARIHEEGRRNLLQRMKAEGLDELTTSCGDIFMVLFAEEGQPYGGRAENPAHQIDDERHGGPP